MVRLETSRGRATLLCCCFRNMLPFCVHGLDNFRTPGLMAPARSFDAKSVLLIVLLTQSQGVTTQHQLLRLSYPLTFGAAALIHHTTGEPSFSGIISACAKRRVQFHAKGKWDEVEIINRSLPVSVLCWDSVRC